MPRKNFTVSNFKCPECGNSLPLPRTKSKPRENGHIKDLYCPWCKKIQKTIEYKSNQSIRNLAGEVIV